MTTLPVDAQARIARALAALELAVVQVQQHPPRAEPDGDGGYRYVGGQSPTDIVRVAVLTALAVIVDVVTAAAMTATDRRQTFTAYQDQLLTQYALHPVRFHEVLRAQSWWARFQQTLAQAERTDIPPINQQLKQLRHDARLTSEQLATATGLTKRAVERHLSGSLVPRLTTLKAYEIAFTTALGRPITLNIPPPSPRKARRKKSVKRRS